MKVSFYILRSQHLKEGILQESKLYGEDLREEPCMDGEIHPRKPHVRQPGSLERMSRRNWGTAFNILSDVYLRKERVNASSQWVSHRLPQYAASHRGLSRCVLWFPRRVSLFLHHEGCTSPCPGGNFIEQQPQQKLTVTQRVSSKSSPWRRRRAYYRF